MFSYNINYITALNYLTNNSGKNILKQCSFSVKVKVLNI